MHQLLLRVGQAAGLLGLLLMLIGVAVRLTGRYGIGGYATGTLLLAGIGAVSAGCFLLLWVLAERARR